MAIAKKGSDPPAARERGHAKAQPLLQHRAKEQHRDREQQADPEAPAEHLLVAAVIYVTAVPALIVACMTVVRRSVFRVCAVSGLVFRVTLMTAVCRSMVFMPITGLLIHRV